VVPPDLVVRDVAVFLRQMLEKEDWIRGSEPAERKPKEVSLKTRREVILAAPGHLVRWNIVPGCSSHLLSLLVAAGS
jgi:hypothetical protein